MKYNSAVKEYGSALHYLYNIHHCNLVSPSVFFNPSAKRKLVDSICKKRVKKRVVQLEMEILADLIKTRVI